MFSFIFSLIIAWTGGYFAIGVLSICIITFLFIGYEWHKAAKSNIRMWHELNKGTDMEDIEPFYF